MFEHNDFDTIKKRTLDNIKLDIDKREGSVLSDLASANAMSLARAYLDMEDIMSIGFIQEGFDSFLDKRVGEFGIYRKLGQKSVGKIVVKGEEGASISVGTIISCGNLQYVLLNEVVLPNEDIGYLEALEVGSKYNILPNSIFTAQNISKDIHLMMNEEEFKLGIDIESDDELRARFLKVVNNPSTSGNKAHYEEWALQVNGVNKAIVYPLWNGNGTVKVMVIGNDGKPVDEEVIKDVTEHIENMKPIGCELTVTTPTLLNLNISASIEIHEGYTLDEVIDTFKNNLEIYLKTVVDEIVYTKIFGVLANTLGVDDFTDLKINNSIENIVISEDSIPSIGDIGFEEVI